MGRFPTAVGTGAVLLAVLAACAGQELQRAQKVEPQGDAFTRALYDGYIDISAREFREGDYKDSDTFALRATAVAQGETVAPEAPGMRVLPEETVPPLAEARRELVAALEASARDKAPDAAARAQVMFDCWMQEQEENFQPADIAECRDAFYAALKVAAESVATKPEPKVEPKLPEPPKFEPLSYVVYFAFDSNILTEAGLAAVERAASYALQFPGTRIEVVGHTDRAGTEAYNDGLGARRAETAKVALTALGVAPEVISKSSMGERDPAEATADGERSRLNRRAVVTVTK